MKGEQFIAEVRNLAELDTNEDAEKAIRVTLETLKERLAMSRRTWPPSSRQRSLSSWKGTGGERPSPCKSFMSE